IETMPILVATLAEAIMAEASVADVPIDETLMADRSGDAHEEVVMLPSSFSIHLPLSLFQSSRSVSTKAQR
ncbi:MAG TPA: hypothetical protein PLM91_01295, partial [Bacillota bacterium]|nr:hypothetical protein [Bacillota bacterium]